MSYLDLLLIPTHGAKADPGRGARPAQGSGGAWPRRSAQARGAGAVRLGAQDGSRAESGGGSTRGGVARRTGRQRRAGCSASAAHGVSAACGAVAWRGRRQPIAVVRRACERERTAPGDRRGALLASSPMHILIGVHVLAAMARSFPVIVLLVPVRHDVHAPAAVVVVEAALQFEIS